MCYLQKHLITEPWTLITPIIESCYVQCGFPIHHVSSNEDSAVKLAEDERMTGTV
jgi:hypothetical protein